MPDVLLKDVWVSVHKSFKLKDSGNISHEVTFSCKMIFFHQLLRSKLIKPISQPAFLVRVSLNGGGWRGLPSLLANLVGPSHGEPPKWNFVSHLLSRWLSKLLLRGEVLISILSEYFFSKTVLKIAPVYTAARSREYYETSLERVIVCVRFLTRCLRFRVTK